MYAQLLMTLTTAALLVSCAARPAWDPALLGDLAPPVLSAVLPVDTTTVELRFDEPVALVEGTLSLETAPPVAGARAEGVSLYVTTAPQAPGVEYVMEASVEDAHGNSADLVARWWGFNPSVPRILINELTTRGSGNHPDLVELRVVTDGDLAGLVLYQGTPGDWTDRIVFPACAVRAGEYVLVHWKPQGIPEEVNETHARDASGGLDATARAADFWVAGGQGLSGNNGALCLCSSARGDVLDAFLYSDRTSENDDGHAGFGSAAVHDRARELVRLGAWVAADGDVRPEDAVSPEGSTATRTMARAGASMDTNTREDWHVTPTRGATWGAANTDERYLVTTP